MTLKALKPPAHLSAAGRQFFADVVREYAVHDPAGLELLATAAAALDRMRQAQKAIAEHGPLVPDRYGGLRANPAVNIERDARAGFISALRGLHLDLEPLRAGPGRPPTMA